MHPACEATGCIDLLHDVIARTLSKLEASRTRIESLPGFAYRTACHELVELKRSTRTREGLPARPGRADGVAGRVDDALRRAHGPAAEWLVAMFRIMRSYPFSSLHAPGRWPVDGLTREREIQVPHEAASPAIVQREIALVLVVARRVAGERWVYNNLTMPLLAHGRHCQLPEYLAAPPEDLETMVLSQRLKEAYRGLRLAGFGPEEALQRATRTVTGRAAPHLTPDLAEALDELDAELGVDALDAELAVVA